MIGWCLVGGAKFFDVSQGDARCVVLVEHKIVVGLTDGGEVG